ncbi:methyltransferase [Frankia sp. Cr1]|uniref:methyltransferase n=1 Tax=Frankia sp. Cr1 TaxID=3073931 RepID=UPI002AD2DB5E|nr:methyltransferase [Frankia sp. Cr1]
MTTGTFVHRSPGRADRETSTVTPEPIIRLVSGPMAAKHVFAANETGIFEALVDSPATIDALAAHTGLTRSAVQLSADAMVALDLLERDGDTYRNGAAAFLTGRMPADLRPFLHFREKINYPACRAIPESFDFSAHRRLLDVGGGTGSWTIAVAQFYPHLEATVLELPSVISMTRACIAEADLTSRIAVQEGDVMTGHLPTGYDVFLVANLIHYWAPRDNRALLERVRRAAGPDARLLLADFWTNAPRTEPLHGALIAGEFALHLRDGDAYSVDEVRGWLPQTGWRFVDYASLAGPQSLIVAEAA